MRPARWTRAGSARDRARPDAPPGSRWGSPGARRPRTSRSPPSVTIPVAPRASARAARMSPIVPAPGSLAGVDHEHLVGPDRLDRALLGVELGAVGVADVLAQRHVAQRVGVSEQPHARGRVGRSPAMNGLLIPRRASWTDKVAVETRAQRRSRRVGDDDRGAVTVEAERRGARRPAPTFGWAPNARAPRRPRRSGWRACRRRRARPRPRRRARPGRASAGVPVRITSPGSSVMKRERSATSIPNEKIRFALESSWTTAAVDARAQRQAHPGRRARGGDRRARSA